MIDIVREHFIATLFWPWSSPEAQREYISKFRDYLMRSGYG